MAAALLRLWGLTWGLPDDTHLFSYHPDEYFSLATVLSVALEGDPNPHFFNYGTLYMSLVAVVARFAHHLPIHGPEDLTKAMPQLILDARLLTVALGVLTVVLVFGVGRSLFGRTAGLAAAASLAVMPLHAVHGHYATVDVPATFSMVLCLLFTAPILAYATVSRRRGRSRSRAFAPGRLYFLAGAAAGLAAATKYNGGLAIIFPLAAHVLSNGRGGRGTRAWLRLIDRRVALTVGALVLGFIIGCPYALLSPAEWWGSAESFQGVSYELHHMRVGEHPAVEATPPGPVFHLVGSLAYGLGWPMLVLALAAVVYAVVKRRRRDWLLLSFLAAWFIMISLANVRYMRYAIPMLPILALLIGRMLNGFMQRAREPQSRLRRVGLQALRIAAVAALCHALVYTWAYDDAMASVTGTGGARADCLLRAGAGVGDAVGLIWPPWFCHPPVAYVNGGAMLRAMPIWRQFRRSPYEVRALGYDPPQQLPEFYVVTSFELRDHERVGTEAWRNVSQMLATHYTHVVQYDPAGQLGKLPGADMHNAPMDWLYPFPQINVYRLRSGDGPASTAAAGGGDGPMVEESGADGQWPSGER